MNVVLPVKSILVKKLSGKSILQAGNWLVKSTASPLDKPVSHVRSPLW